MTIFSHHSSLGFHIAVSDVAAVREEWNGGSGLTSTHCSCLCLFVGCHGFLELLLVGMVSSHGW